MADADEQDTSWHVELETILIEGCDFGALRNICKGRTIPDHLRNEVWQICLSVAGKGDALSAFDELFDMPETPVLREDCQSLVDNLGNDEEDQISIVSDLESIVTFFCKSRNRTYKRDNGWLEILQPMLALKMARTDIYNCFYAILTKYIPKECQKNGRPYHLFRLLLLYHDPELCSFLDSRRISPDTYALSWFRSLFASICDLKVTLKMWDVYFQHSDPFLVFFLALVIVVNAKEQILSMQGESKQEIIDKMTSFPSALDAEDIEDFCSLAQYYATRTPQSFRRDYQLPLFGTSLAAQKHDDVQVSQMLCLPVSINELLQANQTATADEVRYFLVDCRPAEQYNAGHLPVAFHLDANLMLQNPTDFAVAVQALFATQKQAIAAESVAGGEHLCFMGSGRDEEDQYVHMVVAHFLQKTTQYVSVTRGGYAALHSALGASTSDGLTDHNPRACIVCNPEAAVSSDVENTDDFHDITGPSALINKFSSVFKTKGAIVKEKLTNYIKNEQQPADRHVGSGDKVGRRYRNMASVFTIGDEEEDDATIPSSDDEHRDTVNIETWLNKPDVKHAFTCQQVRENGYMCPSHLLVTETHLFVLREIQDRPGMALVQARRALGSIVKITSKKRHPELITFKYGSNDEESGLKITDLDRFLIPKAGEATKVIKHQIMKVLDALDS